MNTEWSTTVAAAEAFAEQKQAAEEIAHERFDRVRSQIEAAGGTAHVTETPEFQEWMSARRASDEAWGAWAVAMDARPDAH